MIEYFSRAARLATVMTPAAFAASKVWTPTAELAAQTRIVLSDGLGSSEGGGKPKPFPAGPDRATMAVLKHVGSTLASAKEMLSGILATVTVRAILYT